MKFIVNSLATLKTIPFNKELDLDVLKLIFTIENFKNEGYLIKSEGYLIKPEVNIENSIKLVVYIS